MSHFEPRCCTVKRTVSLPSGFGALATGRRKPQRHVEVMLKQTPFVGHAKFSLNRQETHRFCKSCVQSALPLQTTRSVLQCCNAVLLENTILGTTDVLKNKIAFGFDHGQTTFFYRIKVSTVCAIELRSPPWWVWARRLQALS